MEGKDGRTERATQKKRQDERKKGNLCLSQEINSLVVLLIGFITLRFSVPGMFQSLQSLFLELARFDLVGDWSASDVREGFVKGSLGIGSAMSPLLFGVIFGTVAANWVQTKPYCSTKALKFNVGALNPVKGIKKLFSAQSSIKLGLGVLKIMIITWIAILVCRAQLKMIPNLQHLDPALTTIWIFKLVFKICIVITLAYVVVAVLDWIAKKRQHEKGMMMTKQEIKDERKQYESSPLVRKAIARKMREVSISRMIAAIPSSTAVITNPDHVAVAIKYDAESMAAPVVVAKGKRFMAQRIKAVARKHGVPIVRRPPTARALYREVRVGDPIPAGFFKVVAEVLAYLHRLGHRVGMAS